MTIETGLHFSLSSLCCNTSEWLDFFSREVFLLCEFIVCIVFKCYCFINLSVVESSGDSGGGRVSGDRAWWGLWVLETLIKHSKKPLGINSASVYLKILDYVAISVKSKFCSAFWVESFVMPFLERPSKNVTVLSTLGWVGPRKAFLMQQKVF